MQCTQTNAVIICERDEVMLTSFSRRNFLHHTEKSFPLDLSRNSLVFAKMIFDASRQILMFFHEITYMIIFLSKSKYLAFCVDILVEGANCFAPISEHFVKDSWK